MRPYALSLALGLLLLSGCSAVAVEEPKFTTVLKDGPFELRDYPALTMAEVTVTGGQWGAANKGFKLLAGYIFGGNSRQQSIAMTAPVLQERMPAPDAERWVVRFIMPAGSTPETLPVPNGSQVQLAVSPPVREAVVQFSGWALSGAVKARTRQLQAWMASRRLASAGPPTLAQYDPPWTLGFLRRNEVAIPVGE